MTGMASPAGVRDVFRGRILGVGSTSGTRIVVGVWDTSPFGAFADAMVATSTGRRILVAPTEQVASYVSATYSFDEVRIEDVVCRVAPNAVAVQSNSLHLNVEVGGPTALGRLLRLIPAALSRSTTFATLCDPVARVVLRGVRTRGTAGNGRTEFYAASDLRSVVSLSGWFGDGNLGDGNLGHVNLGHVNLGDLAEVWPEPGFGFSSTPRTPGLTTLTTTVVR